MNNHQAEAIIVTCIDFRFQEYINNWIAASFQPKTFDRVAFAGGVKSLDTILGQIEIAEGLHHIKKIILINHEDCGAYGESGTAKKHTEDLRNATAKIQQLYPDLEVQTYYLYLNGTFEKIS